jgi:hypothetical protein
MRKLWSLVLLAWARVSDASVAVWLWGVPVSGAASYWAWISQWGNLPIALTGLGVLVATIWLVIGIVWLRRQQRPSRERIAFDYSYAMSLEGIDPAFDPTNTDNTLEIRPKFRNVANGPLKYMIEQFSVQVEDRIVSYNNVPPSIIPRIAVRSVLHKGFRKEAYEQFGTKTSGQMRYSIVYGHPDDKSYSRRITAVVSLDITKPNQRTTNVWCNWVIQEEMDVSIL